MASPEIRPVLAPNLTLIHLVAKCQPERLIMAFRDNPEASGSLIMA
jgi:hypothetical protein